MMKISLWNSLWIGQQDAQTVQSQAKISYIKVWFNADVRRQFEGFRLGDNSEEQIRYGTTGMPPEAVKK